MMLRFVNVFLLWSLSVAQLRDVSQPVAFQTVELGDSATIECHIKSELKKRVWYKFTPGEGLQLVVAFNYYFNKTEFADESHFRYSVKFDRINSHLSISATTWEDAGTYFCGVLQFKDIQFGSGTFLMLKGASVRSDSKVQQLESKSVQTGGSVTLNCTLHTGTCDGRHSVYWFKISEASHPGLIYTDGGRNDQCERKPDTQTHTCVYNLPMKSLNRSHAGTYYCAVASCGHVLFGDGTKLDFEDEPDSLVSVYLLSGALTFTTILSVLLALSVCMMNKRNSCQSTESHARFPAPSTANAQDYQNAEILYYAALSEQLHTGSRRRRDQTWSECVYYSVKQ